MRAIGLVCSDLPSTDAGVAAVRAVAARWSLELTEVLIRSGSGIGRVLAQLSAETEVIVAPSEPHLRGWMNAANRVATVWTADPPRCWPREHPRPEPIPRPDHHLAIDRR